MSEKIALIGFVNTEEILADTIKQQTPEITLDGYEVLPNEAFGRLVDNRYPLYGLNSSGEFGFHNLNRLEQLREGYSAINLGPIPAAFIAEDTLASAGVDYIGPRKNELTYELDKTKIVDVFSNNLGILPATRIIETSDMRQVNDALGSFAGKAVIKFVGDYPKYYQDSETRRVRLIEEFANPEELEDFVNNSIEESGSVVVQEFIDGQQFSYTCIVDGNEGVFRIGENICYKHRFDNEQGPLCDGTGAVAVNNTLPNLLSEDDLGGIERNIVRPYTAYLENEFNRAPKTFLNLDLIKDKSGRIYLLEVNGREPGGHTMANLMSGLATPLVEVLQAAQEGRLSELTPRFKEGASVVVSAYPENFPHPFENDEARPTITIPKLKPSDKVRMYTGWVDVEEESTDTVTVRPQLSPTLLFVNHAPSIEQARDNVYKRILEIVPSAFDYRRDIGR